MSYVYLNNQLLPAAEAKVSIYDRGFAFGDALFETVKVLEGKPVFMREHYQRLTAGLGEAGFGAIPGLEEITRQALELSEKNEAGLGRMRLLVTRGTPAGATHDGFTATGSTGSGSNGPDPAEGLEPTVLLTIEAFSGFPPEIHASGVAVRTVAANRGHYAFLKASGLTGMIIARKTAHDAGAQEAILTTGRGRILEGAYSNIFFLAGDKLVTAPATDPILPGVTRQKIIDMAPDMGLLVEEQAPMMEALGFGETAAFLTSSLLGICPICAINSTALRLDHEVLDRLAEKLAEMELKDIRGMPLP